MISISSRNNDGNVKFFQFKQIKMILNMNNTKKQKLKSLINTYFCYWKYVFLDILFLIWITFIIIKPSPGNFCERVIPDPIPNSEVKPFCADGTLS